jgi:mannose-1-phosphate guanylyltransferase
MSTSPDKPVVALMAGGSGQRFWPLSRPLRPKQLLDLGGGESLLRSTLRRARLLTDLDRVLLVTREDLGRVMADELPELHRANVLLEPVGANTGPCVGLAAIEAGRRYGDPVLVMLPADHRISDDGRFADVVRRGVELARRDDVLVVLGIRPTRPETQYGYIKVGEGAEGGYSPVVSFTEKPDRERAEIVHRTEGYYWNSGVFIWRASVILAALERHAPGIYGPLKPLLDLGDGPLFGERLRSAYADVERVSVDYAVMERADNAILIPADFDWDDLGSWTSLHRVFPSDEAGNTVVNAGGAPDPYLIDCERTLVYNESLRRISLIGLSGAVVVATPDTLMVLPAERSSQVRELSERFDPPVGW